MNHPDGTKPDQRDREPSPMRRALRLAAAPVLIAMVITPVRFLLELAGVPTAYVFLFGLLWLALGFSIYWGVRLSGETRPYRLLWLSLVLFSPVSRIPVFLLWWIDTTWGIGTHYDIFDSWGQAFVGQFFYGSLLQIIPGGILGSLTLAIRRGRAASR